MTNDNFNHSNGSPEPVTRADRTASRFEWLKSKRIAYLTLPLLVMATITEFVILATGWKYQQLVCLPQGMGVTFFHIGPIGATILAVELLKLPLAIWTASRQGWTKAFMLVVGLPLICVLTFQLVKDMAVYEMGVAMKPAGEFLEKAMVEETRISQLKGELASIEQKRTERENKLQALDEKFAKARVNLEDSIKRNNEAREDAISLTDYQKKELSEVESRQATITKQFDADAAQLTKAIADLRARRETEVSRNSEWNAEEARIENEYKSKMAEYTNKKTAYDKDKAEYDNANFLRRQLMREPVSPGVPPEREVNKVLKPVLVAEIDAQIKAKESELLDVNNKRRERVAQVDADARRLREEFDRRSSTKREEADRKREELSAGLAALAKEEKTERDAIDQEFAAVLPSRDRIREELDAAQKKAESYYEAREASIRNTQVHRIATTVEIVRGLIMGERPMSIKATAKERGDVLTDQISMVRIWVYPVLAFIVAFLPTLMVEIGFSTVFKPEEKLRQHRLGFFGRRMHWLYTRAGRIKILRAERLAREATAQLAARNQAVTEARATAEKERYEKETEVQAAREAISAAEAAYAEKLKRYEEQSAAKQKALEEQSAARQKAHEEEWVAKLASMADSLNRTVLEKDALRDFQKSEIERQVQLRQNAWSDRVSQLRQELDEHRATAEAERTALMQDYQKKLLEVTEDCRGQVMQARRQVADAELAAVEASTKLQNDLKEAMHARDTAESQLQQQAASFAVQLSQAREDAAREMEKTVRQEKHRVERQQVEFTKALRQRDEDFERQLQRREQELSLSFEARLAEEQARLEQEARRREAELVRQTETRAQEVDARWRQEVQQREEAAQTRLKQREQQLQAQAETRLTEVQAQAEQELRRNEVDFAHQLETQAREADARLRQELQQADLAFQGRLKQREQELSNAFDLRLTEDQARLEQEARRREAEVTRQFELRVQEADARWKQELQQRDEAAQTRLKQREQELALVFDARLAEEKAALEQEARRRELELRRQFDSSASEANARFRQDLQQKELAYQTKLKQREQELALRADARQTELQNQWVADLRAREQDWERQAEARVRAAETRLAQEAQQKEEMLLAKARQRDQQWQGEMENLRAELKAQHEEALRRREAEADARLLELEGTLRKEMQQKEEAAQVKARQREQELIAQLTAQAEARQVAVQTQWETEAEKKTRAAVEPFKNLLARTEMERDEARQSAFDHARQVQSLEKKLTEVSSFLNSWRNGKHLVGAA